MPSGVLPKDLTKNAVLLDIRDELERAGAPIDDLIAGRTVLELDFTELENGKIPELPQKLVVVCANGTLASLAAEYLRAEGILADVLLGGVYAWRKHLADTSFKPKN